MSALDGLKIAQADSDQAKQLLFPTSTRSRSVRAIDISSSQEAGGTGGVRLRVRFMNSLRLQLQNNGPGGARIASRSFPYLLRQTTNLRFGIHQWNVFRKRVFCRDRLAHSIRHHRIVIDASSELVQAKP